MTPEELRKLGEGIYGARWQSALAAKLKVTTRSIRRWLSGQHKISEPVAMAIKSLSSA